MLRGLTILLVFHLAGEVCARSLGLTIPGPVIGMASLAACLLAVNRAVGRPSGDLENSGLGRVAPAVLGSLGLLFVPAGVGIVQHLPLLVDRGPALFAVLVCSTVVTLVATVIAYVGADRLVRRRRSDAA
jgi:putative effector of murein hydrolase LrgA (UPF0299 family)